ncbi:ECF transporter S component [Caldisalinibacter kiritimatiensis]|uniref:Substrate-specific component PanT of predicted pantothenate ECF transporter n=1 Tax=Caldisalinibacter kiritimatiensis TaxID=1304284 RepID=R1AWU9_9FIRM|nr:ECF transporter S component [Caldisalinibacter kiritimatiensis]EOD01122.1 Substrate-specific component PanT of predicted pantothenate ECF transporter [Caldisalinibacter kiritimatiensis]
MMSSNSKRFSVRKLAIVGVLGSISAVLGLTPLGFIPVGPTRATIMHIPVIMGAILEGPIVGALVGLIFGLFSIFQAISNPTPVSFVFLNPLVSVLPRILIGITSYYSYILFKKLGRKSSLVVLIIIWIATLGFLINTLVTQINGYIAGEIMLWKLILTGILILLTFIVGYFSYKRLKDHAVEVVISAGIGTLTNTIGVLSMIYFIYTESFVEKLGLNPDTAGKVILGIGVTNGIPEVIVAMLIVTSVVMSLKKQTR